MTDWLCCPKCGALMVGLTGSNVCPVCGYTVPVQTVTATTGTGEWYIYEPPKPNKDIVVVIRCKDCKYWSCDDYESFCSELGIFNTDKESYCSYAKRKEE